MNTRNICCE